MSLARKRTAASGWVVQQFDHTTCDQSGRPLVLSDLFSRGSGAPFSGLSLGLWMLAGLALWRGAGRSMCRLLFAWAAVLVFLSLGPCPVASDWSDPSLDVLWEWPLIGDTTWWLVSYLHFYERLAAAGGLMLAVLAGVGLEAAWEQRTQKSRAFLVLWAGYSFFLIVSAQWRSVRAPEVWQPVEVSTVGEFLNGAEPGAVVELPYDQSAQFLSVLAGSGHARVNPVRPGGRARHARKRSVLAWFDGLAEGGSVSEVPSRREIAAEGIRWVFFDPSRCQGEGSFVGRAACRPEVIESLNQILGEGRLMAGGEIRVWELAGGLN